MLSVELMLLKSNLLVLVFSNLNSKELFGLHDIIRDSVSLPSQEPLAMASRGTLIFMVSLESASFISNCAATDMIMQLLLLSVKFTVQLATFGSTGGVGVVVGLAVVVLVVVVFGDGVGWVVVDGLGVVVVVGLGVVVVVILVVGEIVVVVDVVDEVGFEVGSGGISLLTNGCGSIFSPIKYKKNKIKTKIKLSV